MQPAAILMRPILKERVWGGDRLAPLGKPVADGQRIGESWEVADLPLDIADGRSEITRGPGRGDTLRALIERDPAFVLGDAKPADDGGFPVLVKLLDSSSPLSVQVHPTLAYARRHPGAAVKSEAWFVLDADPDAVVYRDLDPALSSDEIRAAAENGTLDRHLQRIAAPPGSCHVLPSGTCHALGGGLLVAEVQTPSDTTFRLYDWGRADRDLHLDQAIECLRGPAAAGETEVPGRPLPPAAEIPSPAPLARTERLARTDAFALDLVSVAERDPVILTTHGRPLVVIGATGRGLLRDADGTVPIAPGSAVLLPAAVGHATLQHAGGGTVLVASVPPG